MKGFGNNMKKLVVVLFASLLLLAGCFGGAKEHVYVMEEDGTELETTITAKGDEVQKVVDVGTTYYEEAGVSSKEEAEEAMAMIVSLQEAMYNEIDGMKYEVEYKDDRAIETLSIDFGEVSDDDLKELDIELDSKDEYISLEKLVEELEGQEFEEK